MGDTLTLKQKMTCYTSNFKIENLIFPVISYSFNLRKILMDSLKRKKASLNPGNHPIYKASIISFIFSSSQISIPKSRAFSYLLPGLSPTITTSVFLLTDELVIPP